MLLNFAKPTKIIRVTNKKNGVTYLYEDQAFWNSEKKRGEQAYTSPIP